MPERTSCLPEPKLTHTWYWKDSTPRQRSSTPHKGEACHIVVPPAVNGNVLVEFENGTRVVAPLNAIRRRRP